MNKTIEYYEKNADAFAENTTKIEFSDVQDRFLKYLNKGDHILDFGCGSGRDSLYFTQKGYKVEALDGSEKLAEIARRNSGIKVRVMDFCEFEDKGKYDGIWACASILHLKTDDLLKVLRNLRNALKPEGILYTSFKYGDYSGERNGRYFTDFNEDSFKGLLEKLDCFKIEEMWITEDVRPGREDEKWLNVILRTE